MANLRDLINERTEPSDLAGLVRGKSFDIDMEDLGLAMKRHKIHYKKYEVEGGRYSTYINGDHFYDPDLEIPLSYALSRLKEKETISPDQEQKFYRFFDGINDFMRFKEEQAKEGKRKSEDINRFKQLCELRDETFKSMPKLYIELYREFDRIYNGFLNDQDKISKDFEENPTFKTLGIKKKEMMDYLDKMNQMWGFQDFYTGIDRELLQEYLPNGV